MTLHDRMQALARSVPGAARPQGKPHNTLTKEEIKQELKQAAPYMTDTDLDEIAAYAYLIKQCRRW